MHVFTSSRRFGESVGQFFCRKKLQDWLHCASVEAKDWGKRYMSMRVRKQLLVPKQITKVGVWIFLLERTFGRDGSISSKKNYYMFQCSKMGSDEQRFDLSEEQLSEIFDVALSLVRKGGEMVRSAINREKKVEEKESAVDLVTETDGAVEKLLFDGLRQVDSDNSNDNHNNNHKHKHKHNNNNNKLWFAFLQGKVPRPQVHRKGDDGHGGDGREDQVLHQRPNLDHRPHQRDHELCSQQPEPSWWVSP